MEWKKVREAFPDQWVLIEVVEAYTNKKSERVLKDITPLQTFVASPEAMKAYQKLHREQPEREMYVIHTSREQPGIIEKKWVGVRGG